MIAALVIAALSALPAALDVPYLPQSDRLCGGAAAAMVFRYWGDAHADPQEFAALVDRRAGGIADDVLVEAIRRRGWLARRVTGSLDALEEPLSAGQPVIVLIADRGPRYHYVVVTGGTRDTVTIHDPSAGPSRSIPRPEFERLWRASDFWSLVVLPSGTAPHAEPTEPTDPSAIVAISAALVDGCGAQLARGLEDIRVNGLGTADATLHRLQNDCPADAGPWRELAGVRFAEHRWRDAAATAQEALRRDPDDAYSIDLLASSLFMQDDEIGALRVWNRIGKPRVNLVRIAGIEHASYQMVAEALAIRPNMLLTVDAFERARRRLDELPDRATARLALRPEPDGFATVDVVVVERRGIPQNRMEWAAAGARAAIERDAEVSAPGPVRSGDVWSATWRWWQNRPGVVLGFAAPRTGTLSGVWRLDAFWDEESYASGAAIDRQSHAGGGLTLSDWISGRTRYSVGGGVDVWNGITKTASVRGAIDRRFAGDRVAIAVEAQRWIADRGSSFDSVGVRLHLTSAAASDGWTAYGTIGAQRVSDAAPLALWPGAGEGRARNALARAHPLLDAGVIDLSGAALLGRSLVDATAEAQRWLDRPRLPRVAIAGFVDAVRVSRRNGDAPAAAQIDVGSGLRVKVPGMSGTLRVDAALGMMDHAHAVTIGWQY